MEEGSPVLGALGSSLNTGDDFPDLPHRQADLPIDDDKEITDLDLIHDHSLVVPPASVAPFDPELLLNLNREVNMASGGDSAHLANGQEISEEDPDLEYARLLQRALHEDLPVDYDPRFHWVCPDCTFLNEARSLTCDMCERLRPPSNDSNREIYQDLDLLMSHLNLEPGGGYDMSRLNYSTEIMNRIEVHGRSSLRSISAAHRANLISAEGGSEGSGSQIQRDHVDFPQQVADRFVHFGRGGGDIGSAGSDSSSGSRIIQRGRDKDRNLMMEESNIASEYPAHSRDGDKLNDNFGEKERAASREIAKHIMSQLESACEPLFREGLLRNLGLVFNGAHILRLPNELLEEIFSFLDGPDLGSLALSCRVFFLIVSQWRVWKERNPRTIYYRWFTPIISFESFETKICSQQASSTPEVGEFVELPTAREKSSKKRLKHYYVNESSDGYYRFADHPSYCHQNLFIWAQKTRSSHAEFDLSSLKDQGFWQLPDDHGSADADGSMGSSLYTYESGNNNSSTTPMSSAGNSGTKKRTKKIRKQKNRQPRSRSPAIPSSVRFPDYDESSRFDLARFTLEDIVAVDKVDLISIFQDDGFFILRMTDEQYQLVRRFRELVAEEYSCLPIKKIRKYAYRDSGFFCGLGYLLPEEQCFHSRPSMGKIFPWPNASEEAFKIAVRYWLMMLRITRDILRAIALSAGLSFNALDELWVHELRQNPAGLSDDWSSDLEKMLLYKYGSPSVEQIAEEVRDSTEDEEMVDINGLTVWSLWRKTGAPELPYDVMQESGLLSIFSMARDERGGIEILLPNWSDRQVKYHVVSLNRLTSDRDLVILPGYTLGMVIAATARRFVFNPIYHIHSVGENSLTGTVFLQYHAKCPMEVIQNSRGVPANPHFDGEYLYMYHSEHSDLIRYFSMDINRNPIHCPIPLYYNPFKLTRREERMERAVYAAETGANVALTLLTAPLWLSAAFLRGAFRGI